MHSIYKSKFLKERRVMKNRVYEMIRSTTSLNTEEFSEYVEKCRRFAEEQGMIIPDPNEVNLSAN